MRREAEFRAFLTKNNKSLDYINYCEHVEKAFGGKDMDEIVRSYRNISKARTKLEAVYTNKNSVDNYICGLNRYLEFVVSATSPTITGSTVVTASSLYHVARAEGVALTKEVMCVARVLEQEYAHIIQFAKELLMQGSFCYIPIIISDETPIQESPDGVEYVLGAFFPAEKPYIEIYYRNGDPSNPAQFRKCLAHEYLHYLHYAYAGPAYSVTMKDLKEAMADFFGVLYSIHRHGRDDLKVAKTRYTQWEKHFYTYWPYAKALHFYQVYGKKMKYSSRFNDYLSHGSVDKFVQVFFASCRPNDAYDMLINF